MQTGWLSRLRTSAGRNRKNSDKASGCVIGLSWGCRSPRVEKIWLDTEREAHSLFVSAVLEVGFHTMAASTATGLSRKNTYGLEEDDEHYPACIGNVKNDLRPCFGLLVSHHLDREPCHCDPCRPLFTVISLKLRAMMSKLGNMHGCH